MHIILSINTGSTSTKIALYEDRNEIFTEVLRHGIEDLAKYERVQDQYDFRKKSVLDFLEKHNYNLQKLDAVVGRGGVLPPVESGAYKVNDEMVHYLKNKPKVEHASNLSAIIAYEISKPLKIPAYIYDSVAVDEMDSIAKISGIPEIERESLTHALNMRASAIKTANKLGKKYEDSRFVVAHLGGGITLSAHRNGKMVDIISDDEGPFSPERSGRVPCRALIDLCFSGKYSKKEIVKKTRGGGGLQAYLHTVDAIEVEKRIKNGDKKAKLIYEAMAYQIAKGIGELATVLDGELDGIIITGGIAYSDMMIDLLRKKINFIGKVIIMPGENEMESLTFGALRVLEGEEKAKEFKLKV